EVAYQSAKKGNELLRDIEMSCCANVASVAAASAVAPRSAGFGAVAPSNLEGGPGGPAGGFNVGPGLVVAYTPGTTRAFTELQFQNAAQLAWVQGGNPTIAISDGPHKRAISQFPNTTVAPLVAGAVPVIQRTEDASGRTLHTAIDVYSHDFGTLSCLPSRFWPATSVGIIDPTLWELGWLTAVETHELAKTGDADKRMLISEWSLISNNQDTK